MVWALTWLYSHGCGQTDQRRSSHPSHYKVCIYLTALFTEYKSFGGLAESQLAIVVAVGQSCIPSVTLACRFWRQNDVRMSGR